MTEPIITKVVSAGTTRSRMTKGARIAALTLAAVALLFPTASPAQAAGLINCVPLGLTGGSGACWESVWVNGVERRMVFPQEAKEFPGTIHSDRVGKFYVTAPQTDTPQGALPFQHDHTIADTNFTKLRGFLVFCSEAGITSGSCETATPSFPLARTVSGQPLKSAEAIESAANSGLVTLIDTGATFVVTITSN